MKTMNYIKIGIASSILSIAAGCTSFLEEDLKSSLAPDNTYTLSLIHIFWEEEAVSSRVSRTGSLSCSYGSHSQAHWPSAKRVSSDRLHANFIFFITFFFVVADTVRNLPDTFLSDPPGGGDEGF